MRLLVVIYEFPPVGGGGGMVAQDICRGLARRGHQVEVLTAHYGDLPATEDLDGVRVHRIVSGRTEPYRAGLRAMSGFVTAGLAAGRMLVRHFRPDLIHVHFAVPSGPVAWALSREFKVPYVLTAHLGDVPGGVPEKTERWFRWIYPFTPPVWKRASRVAAVSEHTRRLAQARYPVDIRVIPNGVDLHELDPGTIQVHQPPQIVFAGRFQFQKNPLQVVRSLAEVRDLDWRCEMLGDGPLLGEVKAEIERLGLSERILLPGWVTPEQVNNAFRQSDILFMPSLSEGLPVVGTRALALGLAIVASEVGGWMDLVTDGSNGSLIDPGRPEAYARALQALLSDPHQLQAARESARRKAHEFDLEAVVDAYERLFKQTLSETSQAQATARGRSTP